MKCPSRLFIYENRDSNQRLSATLTSSLYSVTFLEEEERETKAPISSFVEPERQTSEPGCPNNQVATSEIKEQQEVRLTPAGCPCQCNSPGWFDLRQEGTCCQIALFTPASSEISGTSSGIVKLDTHQIRYAGDDPNPPDSDCDWFELSDSDEHDNWIIVGRTSPPSNISQQTNHYQHKRPTPLAKYTASKNIHLGTDKLTLRQRQMALDKTDLDIIKSSWVPVRRDPTISGLELFKGLFTKFPQYLGFFPQFTDLDLERMGENKRLVRHAVKVIDTVTFVVDSIGDESKTKELNGALLNLVKSHMRRKIGLAEFRNLGVVLIDFICDFNQRRGPTSGPAMLTKSSTNDSADMSGGSDSETMTSALDKIRSSSTPSSSSEDDSFRQHQAASESSLPEARPQTVVSECQARDTACAGGNKLDTNALVVAWTKLYGCILDLVKCEEDEARARK